MISDRAPPQGATVQARHWCTSRSAAMTTGRTATSAWRTAPTCSSPTREPARSAKLDTEVRFEKPTKNPAPRSPTNRYIAGVGCLVIAAAPYSVRPSLLLLRLAVGGSQHCQDNLRSPLRSCQHVVATATSSLLHGYRLHLREQLQLRVRLRSDVAEHLRRRLWRLHVPADPGRVPVQGQQRVRAAGHAARACKARR